MKIGVVMPTYNQARFLPAALASYEAQFHKNSKLVVVNDGSSDHTGAILQAWPGLSVISHEVNRGSAEAINTGVAALTAAFSLDALSWISSDNVMDPDWLRTLAVLMESRKAGAVYGGFWYERERGVPTYLFRWHTKDGLLKDQNCYYGPAFLIRRDVWQEAGAHRGRISHDYDHWLRVEEVCFRLDLPIVGVDRPLCRYNAHAERVTVTRAREYDADKWQLEARKRRGVK